MYARERIRVLLDLGNSISKITETLRLEGIVTCRQTVWRLKRHIDTYGNINPLQKSGRRTKLTQEILQAIDSAMEKDDERLLMN